MLVEPAQLRQWIEGKQVSIFDCRFSLQDKSLGKRLYEEAHIAGAVYLDLETDLSAPASAEAGRHPLPSPGSFAAKISEFGADDAKPVVFYDNGEGMAARGWWLMRYIGHQYVYLLNGGYDRWKAEGYPVTDEKFSPPSGQLSVNVQDHMIASEELVEQIADGRKRAGLLDARASVRYRGDEEPIDPKPGHIPSAKNAPWTDGVDQQGRWLTPEQQRSRFQELGADVTPIVHYCGSGVTACNNVFAMELAGVKDVLLYPGSWSQWCNKEYHPVATGDE